VSPLYSLLTHNSLQLVRCTRTSHTVPETLTATVGSQVLHHATEAINRSKRTRIHSTSTSPTTPVTETLRAPTATRPFLNRLLFVGGQINHAFVQFQQFSQRQLVAGARCPTNCKFTAPACHKHAASSSIRDRHLEIHSTVVHSTATTTTPASRSLLSPHRPGPLPASQTACLPSIIQGRSPSPTANPSLSLSAASASP
jgi:hypothetical protein